MRTLVFVVGGAGAGKTTLGQEIARRHRMSLLDMDTLLRPAAVALMIQAGEDPEDRDSAVYKRLCRDLGYRITMDAALENLQIGLSAVVIGPFTKETADQEWLTEQLARIGASLEDVAVKVIYVTLSSPQVYYERIKSRGSHLDAWKLEHWADFCEQSLAPRKIAWALPPESLLTYANDEPLDADDWSRLDAFVQSPI